jgi:hypothetical protein
MSFPTQDFLSNTQYLAVDFCFYVRQRKGMTAPMISYNAQDSGG